MFGLLDISLCSLGRQENRYYTCGVCDALALGYGVMARAMLSKDAVYLSLLTSAQLKESSECKSLEGYRPAGKCMFWSKAGPSSRQFAYPAAASMVAYYGLLIDRLQDEPSLRASARYAMCRGKMAKAQSRLKGFGLSLPIKGLVAEQHSVERGSGSIHDYSHVTEVIYSALFSHSAVVAGMAENAPGLAEVGRHVGRMAYLVDGYVDAEVDKRRGSFNACTVMASSLGISGTSRLRKEVESRANGSLEAIRRAMSTVHLRSHDVQIRHSLTEGLRSRVSALISLSAVAKTRPRRFYLYSIAPFAIFMVKGLSGVSQGDDYCCSTDCLTCGISEEDCCSSVLPPGSTATTGAIASSAVYGGVGAIVGAGIGILASGIGGSGSAEPSGTPGSTPETPGVGMQPPPEFMQQWGSPPRQAEPYPEHSWIDWRDDWLDASEDHTRRQRGITPGEELKEILEDRPPWMRDFDYPTPDNSDFYRKYGSARYLGEDQIAKLPPDKQAEYNRWKERYASWQRRNRVESEFVSVQGSRG